MAIEVRVEARGEGVVYRLSAPPSALPAVAKRDLEQAWEAAQDLRAGAPERIFLLPGGAELRLTDPDAAAWAAAVERVFGLETAHGLSVCLRLLALVGGMAEFAWARAWFASGDIELHGEMLRAASVAPLNEAGGFDETVLHALLPPHRLRKMP